MIYIKTDETNQVIYVHKFPLDPVLGLGKTLEELQASGRLVESIPDPEVIPDKTERLYYTEASGFEYVYHDRKRTPEEIQAEKLAELDSLKEQQALMQAVLDDIILNGGVI